MSPAAPIHVVCAVIEQNGLILCAQRSESMALPLKWEFPGGKIEPGEAEEPALMREIQEELNVKIEILERMPVQDYAYTRRPKWQAKFPLTKPSLLLIKVGPVYSGITGLV